MTFFYWFCWRLARSIAQIIFRRKVRGLENIPREGPFILASNHISLADPPMLSTSIKRPIHFMAKKELFNIFILGTVIRNLNSHPIHRGFDRRALELAVEILKKGDGLLIFLEGTRSRTNGFLPAKPGVGLVALKTGAPIIPAYISGSNRLLACFLGRERLSVVIGKPLDSSESKDYPDTKDGYRMLAEAVMGRISDLKKDSQKHDRSA
ncbi:MAG: 1-acyl-sn-glycerol-3-phosphate acyltransferase [candidate division Zixibacteria bacterium HGW-Zixibacteria-1]|nr:MAG: 1-acyl-sn-glycerol-3-phosphate acyltransferase [candidate division Zixibacteria bacterium HGW-Zixibacteria-1]